jgi:hypothetical protein
VQNPDGQKPISAILTRSTEHRCLIHMLSSIVLNMLDLIDQEAGSEASQTLTELKPGAIQSDHSPLLEADTTTYSDTN